MFNFMEVINIAIYYIPLRVTARRIGMHRWHCVTSLFNQNSNRTVAMTQSVNYMTH